MQSTKIQDGKRINDKDRFSHLHLLRYQWKNDQDTHRALVDAIVAKFGDFTQITSSMILEQDGGSEVLKKYGSVGKVLVTMFPEYGQAGKREVLRMVQQWKMSKVQDLIHVPKEYQVFHKGWEIGS